MGDQQVGNIQRGIGIGKDVVAVGRDGALLLLAVLLLAFPSKLNDVLVNAGFEEGSIVGFKWKARLVQSDEALQSAQATITDLKAQLEKTTKALSDAQARAGDGGFGDVVRQIEKESRQAVASSAEVQTALRTTIASNAPLVEKAQSAVAASGGWGVVFGSDGTLQAARDEIARAEKAGIVKGAIYFRNGYYASIAVVEDRATAQSYLIAAKRFRPDAYITSMATWCRSPQQREGFLECRSGP
jgi:uncharacterized protein YukE